jgi:hypothetical protein
VLFKPGSRLSCLHDGAFRGCSSLSSIRVPSSVDELQCRPRVFRGIARSFVHHIRNVRQYQNSHFALHSRTCQAFRRQRATGVITKLIGGCTI